VDAEVKERPIVRPIAAASTPAGILGIAAALRGDGHDLADRRRRQMVGG